MLNATTVIVLVAAAFSHFCFVFNYDHPLVVH